MFTTRKISKTIGQHKKIIISIKVIKDKEIKTEKWTKIKATVDNKTIDNIKILEETT
jgi:hypothetical protein